MNPMTQVALNLVGQTLGQYEITEQIGAGGMVVVYKAYQPGLEREVAIKVMGSQLALNPVMRERFLREARAVAQFSHPNILPIYDVGQKGDLSYFVMKYVPGHTLHDMLGTPMDLELVSHFVDQLASALDHAHSHNVLHRDIKPSNILVEGDWILLSDFGLAKYTFESKDLTGSGMIIGTPSYLSPEQAEGRPVDARADIYSLGVVIYEMVTGRVPFAADTPMGVIFKHIYEPLPQPRRHNPNLPREAETIISKALAKSPADRYASAGELALALRAQLHPAPDSLHQTIQLKPYTFLLCYKQGAQPDEHLAAHLRRYFSQQGHSVYSDQALLTDDSWLSEVDKRINDSDFMILLLSQESAHSEMLQAQVKRTYEHFKRQGQPKILPVRVAYDGLLPYAINDLLEPQQYLTWQGEADDLQVAQDILAAIEGRLPQSSRLMARPVSPHIVASEDGRIVDEEASLLTPLPEFDPRILETLETPGGVVKLRDKFYIERDADALLKREIIKPGTTTTIRASRQMGKSSLMVRGMQHARDHGAGIVNLDLQRVDNEYLNSLDAFLRYLAEFLTRKLRLDVGEVEQAWAGALGAQDKLTYLMEDYILPETDSAIILALDEVDRLLLTPFHTSFFALLRSWHNSRAFDEEWDKLNMIMVISTEPYLLIDDVNQSPFNVGLQIILDDFDEAQVRHLNQEHGSPVSEAEFPYLLKLLGGHPYLTRMALYTMLSEQMPWTELTRVAVADQGPFGDHLRRHHWLLRDEPNLRAALKQVIEKSTCSDQLALFRLLQAGLIKGSGEFYTCRCDLYRMYLEDKL
jgi:serine/threonine protein kinase